MQKKKIFIEINLPSQLRRRLALKIANYSDLPIKWMKEKNFHITVAFVGYVDESMIPEICSKVCHSIENFESFELEFNSIELGPDTKNPKLIWLTGKPCVELGMLNEEVERSLGMRPSTHKEFRPHITLGRIKKLKWDELVEKPVICEKMNVSISVDVISVMESKGGGEDYVSLEDCSLA